MIAKWSSICYVLFKQEYSRFFRNICLKAELDGKQQRGTKTPSFLNKK